MLLIDLILLLPELILCAMFSHKFSLFFTLLLMLYLCVLYIFIFFFLYLIVNKVDYSPEKKYQKDKTNAKTDTTSTAKYIYTRTVT